MKTVIAEEKISMQPGADGLVGLEPAAGETQQPDGHTMDRERFDLVFSLAYEELRRLAVSVRRNDPNAAVTPTTIVNEVWKHSAV